MYGMDLSVRDSVTALLLKGESGYVRTYPTDESPPFKPLVREAGERVAHAPSDSPPNSIQASAPLRFSELFESL